MINRSNLIQHANTFLLTFNYICTICKHISGNIYISGSVVENVLKTSAQVKEATPVILQEQACFQNHTEVKVHKYYQHMLQISKV